MQNSISTKRFLALSVSVILHIAGVYYLGSLALDYALPDGSVDSVEMDYAINEGAQTETTEVDVLETPAPATPAQAPEPQAAPKLTQPAAPKPVAQALPAKEETPTETPVQEESPVAVPVVEEPAPAQPEALPAAEVSEDLQKDLLKEEPTAQEVPATDPLGKPSEAVEAPVAETEKPVAAQATTQPYGRPEGVQSDKVLTPMVGNRAISYPTMARLRKIEGTTIVHYTVSGEGLVTDVQIAQSSGSTLLDNQATAAIKTWKFKPTGQTGVYERPIRFRLAGDAKEAPAQLRRTTN